MNTVIISGTLDVIYPIQKTRRGTSAITALLAIEDNTDSAATCIAVAAYGQMAHYVSKIPEGSTVMVEGSLYAYTLTTGGDKRQKVEVRPNRITRVVDAAEVIDGPIYTEPKTRREEASE